MCDEGQGCCRELTPKVRILILGYLELIGEFGALVTNFPVNSGNMTNGMARILITICVACVIAMMISILLIVGVKKNNPGLLSPWLVMQAIGLICLLFAPFYVVVEPLKGPDLASFLFSVFVGLVFGTYFWNLVFKYKKAMKREAQQKLTGMRFEPTETV